MLIFQEYLLILLKKSPPLGNKSVNKPPTLFDIGTTPKSQWESENEDFYNEPVATTSQVAPSYYEGVKPTGYRARFVDDDEEDDGIGSLIPRGKGRGVSRAHMVYDLETNVDWDQIKNNSIDPVKTMLEVEDVDNESVFSYDSDARSLDSVTPSLVSDHGTDSSSISENELELNDVLRDW